MGELMKGIEKHFVRCGAILLALGMLLGLYMAATENFKVGSVHAHLAIFGGAVLIIYGLVYHAGLAKNDIWAVVLLWISVIGAIAFPLGEYFAITAGAHVAAGIASLLVLASGLLFVFNVVRA
jgi:hypothetical protein